MIRLAAPAGGAGLVDRPLPPAPAGAGGSRAAAPARPRPRDHARRPWRVWPGLLGLGAIAALAPLNGHWPAQAALLALLLVVPGTLLLRAIRVPVGAIVATPVYAVGASLVVVMATGLGVSLLGPPLGVAEPLRPVPLLIGIEAVGAVLLALCAAAGAERGAHRMARHGHPGARLWPLALPLGAAAGAAM